MIGHVTVDEFPTEITLLVGKIYGYRPYHLGCMLIAVEK